MSRKEEGDVQIEVEGQTYSGTWKVKGDVITVSFGAGPPKSTQLGRWSPAQAASQLLSELVDASLADKKR